MDPIGTLLLIKASSRVFLYDPQITEEVWTVDFSGYKTLLADANGILVIENDEEAIAFDAESGKVLWSLRLGDPYDQSVTTNDIYGKRSYATVNRNLISVELGDGTDAHYSGITGELLFHTDLLAGYNTGSNHRIFRVESTSYLVDLETATIIHEFSSSPSSQIFTESALVFERDGVIFRLDFHSLEEQIIIEIGTGGYDVIDRLLFVNQFSDPGLKIIDIDSGQRLATLDQGYSNNLKYRYQSTLFIKSEDRLAAFNLQSNELFLEIDWDYWPLAAGYARVELEDGTSVWGDSEWGSPHQIVALSASGAQAWSYSSTAELFMWAFVQSDNADVLWMHDNKLLYAMDCTDGSVMATVAPKLGANALISRFAHDRILLGDPEKSYLYKIP